MLTKIFRKKIKSIEDIKSICIEAKNDCWVYPHANPNLYPNFAFNGERIGGHRLVKILQGYVFKEGEDVCHSCDNRRCLNPDHIFIGTRRDNVLDMVNKNRNNNQNLNKTHCIRGHEFNDQNSRYYINHRNKPARSCRLCTAYRHKQRKLMLKSNISERSKESSH